MKSSLFDNTMEIIIPDEFVDNADCIRYPYKNKPPVIMTNEELKTDITFNRLKIKLAPTEVKAAIKSVLILFQKREDMEKISDYHFFQGQNIKGYWMFFVNRGIDESRYNFLAVFPIRNQFTMVTLSTEYANRKEGRRVFLDMIASVKDQTRGIWI